MEVYLFMEDISHNNMRIDTVVNSIKHVYDFLCKSKFSRL